MRSLLKEQNQKSVIEVRIVLGDLNILEDSGEGFLGCWGFIEFNYLEILMIMRIKEFGQFQQKNSDRNVRKLKNLLLLKNV